MPAMGMEHVGIPLGERPALDPRAWSLFGALVLGGGCGPAPADSADTGGEEESAGSEDTTGGPECTSDADCPSDELCYEGMCVAYSADEGGTGYYYDCYVDADCNPFETCVDHECTGGPPALPACETPPTWAMEIALPDDADHLATSVTFVNADEDAARDLALAGPEGVTLLLGPGGGSPIEIAPGLGGFGEFVHLAAADLDADGHDDLLWVTDVDGGELHVALGDGAGTFTAGPTLPATGVAAFAARGSFGDDALPDLALALATGVALFDGDGTGAFTPGASLPAPSDTALAAGDLTGDGRDELVARANASGVLQWWDTVAPQPTVIDDALLTSLPLAFSLVAYDGQAGADLIRLDRVADADSLVTWWSGTGAGLGAATPYFSSFTLASMTSGDFDDDGDTDLAFGTPSAQLVVLYGDVDAFPGCQAPHQVGGPHVRASGDFDGDGRDEVIVHDDTHFLVFGVTP